MSVYSTYYLLSQGLVYFQTFEGTLIGCIDQLNVDTTSLFEFISNLSNEVSSRSIPRLLLMGQRSTVCLNLEYAKVHQDFKRIKWLLTISWDIRFPKWTRWGEIRLKQLLENIYLKITFSHKNFQPLFKKNYFPYFLITFLYFIITYSPK